MTDNHKTSLNQTKFISIATEDPVQKTGILPEDSFYKLAFFLHFKENFILFKQFIQVKNFEFYPEKIIYFRTLVIFLIIAQIITGIVGIIYYYCFNSDRINLIGNIISLIIGLFGLKVIIKINRERLKIFSYLSISIPILFFISHILKLLFIKRVNYSNIKENDIIYELIFSFHYLLPVNAGIFSYKFEKELKENLDLKKLEINVLSFRNIILLKSIFSQKYLEEHIECTDKELCIICLKSHRNIILLPCTHLVVCEECIRKAYALNIASISNPTCPKCRKKIGCYYKIKPKGEKNQSLNLNLKSIREYSMISGLKRDNMM